MARRHYWQFLVTDEGYPVDTAAISIYEAGSDIPLTVYKSENTSETANVTPQTYTSKKGFFEFWIGDLNESAGYDSTTKIRIEWDAPGVTTGFIDNIDIFSEAILPVDLVSIDQSRNKAVSDYLARGWELHKDFEIAVDGTSVHGLQPVNPSSSDGIYNKVISNALAKTWGDHVTGVDDAHTQYVLVDGTRGFEGVVQGVTPLATSPNTSLVTKQYLIDAGIGGDITAHTLRTDNPHSVTIGQIGAASADHTHEGIPGLTGINSISNPGGTIDIIADTDGSAISIVSNPVEKKIYISETHSELTNNPHNVTAAQIGAAPADHTHDEGGGTSSGSTSVIVSTENVNIQWPETAPNPFDPNTWWTSCYTFTQNVTTTSLIDMEVRLYNYTSNVHTTAYNVILRVLRNGVEIFQKRGTGYIDEYLVEYGTVPSGGDGGGEDDGSPDIRGVGGIKNQYLESVTGEHVYEVQLRFGDDSTIERRYKYHDYSRVEFKPIAQLNP